MPRKNAETRSKISNRLNDKSRRRLTRFLLNSPNLIRFLAGGEVKAARRLCGRRKVSAQAVAKKKKKKCPLWRKTFRMLFKTRRIGRLRKAQAQVRARNPGYH